MCVWERERERERHGRHLLSFSYLQKRERNSEVNKCRNCPKDSRFRPLSIVSPPIFKNGSLYLWNLNDFNFHCLEPFLKMVWTGFSRLCFKQIGVGHWSISWHLIAVAVQMRIALVGVAPADVTWLFRKGWGFELLNTSRTPPDLSLYKGNLVS